MIYIAGSYKDRERLKELAHELILQGFRITSTWLNGLHEGAPDETCAKHDLEEISVAELFILDCMGSPSTGGGRWVELGYAIAKDIPVILYGEARNVFCHLPQIHVATNSTELVEMLHELS